MALDRSFVERNRASTNRLKDQPVRLDATLKKCTLINLYNENPT